MSNPGLVFFLWIVSYPESLAPELQEDWISTLTGNVNIPLSGAERINPGHGTKNCKRGRWYKSDQHKFMSINLVLQEILVTAPELQEDEIGTITNYNS